MIVDAVPSVSSTLREGVGLEGAENAEVQNLQSLCLDVFVRTPDYYGYSVKDVRHLGSTSI